MSKYWNIAFIIIILIAVFFSQQPFGQKVGGIVYEWIEKNIYEKAIKEVWEKVVNWWNVFVPKVKDFIQKQIISRITGEVEKRKEIVKEELEEEKEKVTESIWQGIKNYFQEQLRKIFNKNEIENQ